MEELKKMMDDLGTAWEEFKRTNDERLRAVEAKTGTAELDQKLERLNGTIAQLSSKIEAIQKKTNRPEFGADGGSENEVETAAHKNALFGRDGYARKGENGRAFIEHKTLSSGSNPDGGYLLPTPTIGAINRVALDQVAMYGLASVTPVGGGMWSEPVVTSGMTAGHTGETGTRGTTSTPKVDKIDIRAEESYVQPPVYNHLLEDAEFDIESWLIEEAGYAFADLDDSDFITGNGINCARGITAYTMITNASYAWGKVGYVVTGKSSAFADTDPADAFIDVEDALKAKYHTNARYLMKRATLSLVRKMKDGQGNYLWQPGLVAGVPNLINGYQYALSDHMPAVGSNSYSIAFGDFRSAYRIITRRGMTILRDPYTTKGMTSFYISKRLGGGIKNFEALKFVKFGSS